MAKYLCCTVFERKLGGRTAVARLTRFFTVNSRVFAALAFPGRARKRPCATQHGFAGQGLMYSRFLRIAAITCAANSTPVHPGGMDRAQRGRRRDVGIEFGGDKHETTDVVFRNVMPCVGMPTTSPGWMSILSRAKRPRTRACNQAPPTGRRACDQVPAIERLQVPTIRRLDEIPLRP